MEFGWIKYLAYARIIIINYIWINCNYDLQLILLNNRYVVT